MKAFEILKEFRASQTNCQAIIPCFGEIDIRTQVIKRAIADSSLIADKTRDITEGLFKHSDLLENSFNVPVIISQPIPTTMNSKNYNETFPTFGSPLERNYATRLVSEFLTRFVHDSLNDGKRIFTFSLFEDLTCFHEILPVSFSNGIHLNLKGFAFVAEKLREHYTRFG